MHCRCCCRCRGHQCAGGVWQWWRATVATPGEWQCKTARSGEWDQHFSNASCLSIRTKYRQSIRLNTSSPFNRLFQAEVETWHSPTTNQCALREISAAHKQRNKSSPLLQVAPTRGHTCVRWCGGVTYKAFRYWCQLPVREGSSRGWRNHSRSQALHRWAGVLPVPYLLQCHHAGATRRDAKDRNQHSAWSRPF